MKPQRNSKSSSKKLSQLKGTHLNQLKVHTSNQLTYTKPSTTTRRVSSMLKLPWNSTKFQPSQISLNYTFSLVKSRGELLSISDYSEEHQGMSGCLIMKVHSQKNQINFKKRLLHMKNPLNYLLNKPMDMQAFELELSKRIQ